VLSPALGTSCLLALAGSGQALLYPPDLSLRLQAQRLGWERGWHWVGTAHLGLLGLHPLLTLLDGAAQLWCSSSATLGPCHFMTLCAACSPARLVLGTMARTRTWSRGTMARTRTWSPGKLLPDQDAPWQAPCQGSGAVPIPRDIHKTCRCGTSGHGLAAVVVLGWRLDLMISQVFSNLNDSMIL